MTGTSVDGIDVSYIKSNGLDLINLNSNYFYKFDELVRNKILDFMNENLNIKIKFKKYFDNLITKEHYNAIREANVMGNVDIVGFHGQTIHHSPQKQISIQCGNPKFLSRLLNKRVVFDFRQNDIDNKGQGAPLAPIYHKHIIEKNFIDLPACILNIGGISNITYFDGLNLIGFDTGPGNCLIDDFVKLKLGINFDENGKLGFQGSPNKNLLDFLLNNDFFSKKPPKSLDRNFLKKVFQKILKTKINVNDIISTLSHFTVECVLNSINFLPKYPRNIVITGGGNRNDYLLHLLKKKISCNIITNQELNINGDYIESELIGYLSARTFYKLPITFSSTTGVVKDMCGGKIYYYKNPF